MQAWAQANAEARLRPRASRASALIEGFILQIKTLYVSCLMRRKLMNFEATLSELGQNGFIIALAIIVLLVLFKGVRIVPQSEKFVVERFGRLKSVLGPGLNFIVPFLDRDPAPGLGS